MAENQKYDAVIVLANLMDEKGILNQETRSRVDTAVQALRSNYVPLLVTCGWAYRNDSDICIADAMKRYAVDQLHVTKSIIIAETNPRDTVGDAVFTKRNLAVPRNWSKILLVTSAYHADRSHAIFSFIYGANFHVDIIPTPSDQNAQLQEAETRSMEAFRSTFDGVAPGDDEAIFERLRSRHPFYNGQIYAKV